MSCDCNCSVVLLTVPWVGLQCMIVVFPCPTHMLLLENDQSAKYICIIINENIDRYQHISGTSSKAAGAFGFVHHRNFAFEPKKTEEITYINLPKLEYAASTWYLYSKSKIYQIIMTARCFCRRWQNTRKQCHRHDRLSLKEKDKVTESF